MKPKVMEKLQAQMMNPEKAMEEE